MPANNRLGLTSNQRDAVEESSRKATPSKSQEREQTPTDPRSVAERTKDFYEEMIIKVREGEEATDRWRKERNQMEYIRSPRSTTKPSPFDIGNF